MVHMNNWYMVLLNGFGTVSAILDDDAVKFYALLLYERACEALAPQQANLPLTSAFETGTIIRCQIN